MPQIPYEDQTRCAQRELALRRKVYPRQVAARKMTQDEADREIAAMEAIVATLARLRTLHGDAVSGQRALFDVPD